MSRCQQWVCTADVQGRACLTPRPLRCRSLYRSHDHVVVHCHVLLLLLLLSTQEPLGQQVCRKPYKAGCHQLYDSLSLKSSCTVSTKLTSMNTQSGREWSAPTSTTHGTCFKGRVVEG